MSIDPKLPDIDFSKIRVLKNSKNRGFEELAVQLFRSSLPVADSFYRVDDAGGDGGVEAIAYIGDERIGLQAKYFDKLTQTQWSQINKSVKTAIMTHAPKLVEYRILTPQNRSKETKTWENYKSKWNKYAKDEYNYTQNICFVWQGDTELRDELIKEEHRSHLYYWFDFPYFSVDWLSQNIKNTMDLIDTRYTPECHIPTHIEKQLDAFSLSSSFRKSFKEEIKNIKNEYYNLKLVFKDLNLDLLSDIQQQIDRILTNQFDQFFLPNFSTIETFSESITEILNKISRSYLDLQDKESEPSFSGKKYDYEIIMTRKFQNEVYQFRDFFDSFCSYDKQFVLITGKAGTGKSHLLAKFVEKMLEQEQPCLLFAGEQFDSTLPRERITGLCDWTGNFKSLLHVLDTAAEIIGKPAVIVIDALNESEKKNFWKSHLVELVNSIQEFPKIKLVISCMTDYIEFTVPVNIIEKNKTNWETIDHRGFDIGFIEAIKTYFKSYNVKSPHFPPLLEEFKNPLFLKTFCEAYENSKIPEGSISFNSVMKARLRKCQEKISKSIDCPGYKTKKAVEIVAMAIKENRGQAVSCEKIRGEIDSIFDGGGESKSLYIHLRSIGIFVETISYKGEIFVRFPYERFSDYFIALQLISEYKTIDELRESWKKENLPYEWVNKLYLNSGLVGMLSILIPEHFDYEFIDLFPNSDFNGYLHEVFLDSLPWRSGQSLTERAYTLFKECEELIDKDKWLNIIYQLASIPGHPFNSQWLHTNLKSLELPLREQTWTIPVSNLTSYDDNNSINNFISWIFAIPSDFVISDKQIWLVALGLAWLLTSNFRFLRYRASLALVKVLVGHTGIAIQLLDEFHDCNDPYVVERIYATLCGVALRENNIDNLESLCRAVYIKMFSDDNVSTNIIQRDYAQMILAYGYYRKVLPKEIKHKNWHPPFRSMWPKIPTEEMAKKIENQNDWYWIKSSLRSESMGNYGDFGRYIMDSAVFPFSNQKLTSKYQLENKYDNTFNGTEVRRYILGRIKQLGWDAELFAEYEKHVPHGRQQVDIEENKVERISKKYQWIGLYELLGSLADHNWMQPSGLFGEEAEICQSAREVKTNKFDPTQPLIDPKKKIDFEYEDGNSQNSVSFKVFSDILGKDFSNIEARLNREKWVSTPPLCFKDLIEIKNKELSSEDYLLLSGFPDQKEELELTQDEEVDGRLRLWTNIRCWLVKNEDLEQFIKFAQGQEIHGRFSEFSSLSDLWLGEYPWSYSSKSKMENYGFPEWLYECPSDIIHSIYRFSDDSEKQALLPSPGLLEILKLYWDGTDYQYIDSTGEKIVFCLFKNSEPYLIVKKDTFLKKLSNAGYTPIWTTLSEKSCYNSLKQKSVVMKWSITQRLYVVEDGELIKIDEKNYYRKLYG